MGWTGACFLLFGGTRPACGQQSLTVQEAIAAALHSPAAQVLEAQVDEARGLARQAGLGPNPRLFLTSEDLRPWASDYDFPNQTEDYGYLSQTVEVAGKRKKRVALAEARLTQTEADRALRLQGIAANAAASYWNAATSERIVGLLRQDMQAVDEMVRYDRARVDAGAMRGVDLLRMQVEQDRLTLALRNAERDAALARVELFRQMGRAPAKDVQFRDAPEDLKPVAPVPLATVLAQRPDVRSARDAVQAAEADATLQHALAKPDPDVLAGYKRNSTQNTLFAGVQVPLPIFNRNQGEIERSQAAITAARSTLQQTELQVQADVAAAQENYDRDREIVQKVVPDMRSRAAENLRILTEAYQLGGVDLLRFLDAERTEFDVEVNALRTLVQYQTSALRLQQAYGVQP